MSFLESPRLSDQVTFGSVIVPRFRTTKIETLSGRRFGNQEWPSHYWRFDLVPALKRHPELKEQLIDFYIAAAGSANGFRVRNPIDWKSCPVDETPAQDDQQIGTGDGIEDEYQVTKTTTVGTLSTTKIIYKLVSGTLLVAVNGVLQTEGSDYAANYNTGLITFDVGSIPAVGHAVTCGYENDTPVEFESDEIPIDLLNRIGSDLLLGMDNLALVEMVNPS